MKGACQEKDAHQVSSALREAANSLHSDHILHNTTIMTGTETTYCIQAAFHYAWCELNSLKVILNKCSYIWNAGTSWVHISLVRVYCGAIVGTYLQRCIQLQQLVCKYVEYIEPMQVHTFTRPGYSYAGWP